MTRLLLAVCLTLLALACGGQVDAGPDTTPVPEDCVWIDSTDLCPSPTAKSDLYYCGPPGSRNGAEGRYMLLMIHDGEGTTLEWPATPTWNLTALEARRALCKDGTP